MIEIKEYNESYVEQISTIITRNLLEVNVRNYGIEKVQEMAKDFTVEKLKEHNYPITFEIEENWYRQDNKLLGNKEFLVQDPDGYLLRFSEDLGEKEVI